MKSIKTIHIGIILLFMAISSVLGQNMSEQGISPFPENPWYWQYKGKPVVLIGGSDEDNLFQWTGKQLTDHLDLLVSVGGNYLRNTMSDRDEGNEYAFAKTKNGKFDFNQWNKAYWDRLTFFLDETSKRDIIVQLTLWDHFDITSSHRWKIHPWNSENTINIKPDIFKDGHDFYASINHNNKDGLAAQQKFIDKLLSITLGYGNVLYNINNESSETPEWENYWSSYIKKSAEKMGKKAYVTTLQFDPSNAVRFAMSNPNNFDFVDISQNNQDSRGSRAQGHWDNLMYLRQKIASSGPMPMNNVKVYGGLDGKNYSAGSESEAIDRFWRNIIGGCAAARFHRPTPGETTWGSGLNKSVQTNLKAMDMLLEELDIISCSPHNDLLSSRVRVPTTMQAYATANIGKEYAVYFPNGRYTINLDPWVYVKKLSLRWLDIENLKWSEPEVIEVEWEGSREDWGNRGNIHLETPGNRRCVALLEVIE